MPVNNVLKRERILRGWSQERLAEQIGTSANQISRWERGATSPSPYFRERLCNVFEKSTEELGLKQIDVPDLQESSPRLDLQESSPWLDLQESSPWLDLQESSPRLDLQESSPWLDLQSAKHDPGLPGVTLLFFLQSAHPPRFMRNTISFNLLILCNLFLTVVIFSSCVRDAKNLQVNATNYTCANLPITTSLHNVTLRNKCGHKDRTFINHKALNGNANAKFFVTENLNPVANAEMGVGDTHNMGVAYNKELGRWTINNLDGSTLPPGAAFNIDIPSTNRSVFTHTVTQLSKYNFPDSTFLNNPLLNNNPHAELFITVNTTNVDNSDSVDNTHPIGVWYNAQIKKWGITNLDQVPMSNGIAFNVEILPVSNTVFVHKALATNRYQISSSTFIDNPLLNNNPYAELLVTANVNPDTTNIVRDAHPIGVWYNAALGKWGIANTDLAPIDNGAAFNVQIVATNMD